MDLLAGRCPGIHEAGKLPGMLPDGGAHAVRSHPPPAGVSPGISRRRGKKQGRVKNMDNVNHPAHYTSGGIECIEAIRASLGDKEFADYCKGNIIKYLWRYRLKNGLEDLKKAKVYLDWMIDAEETEYVAVPVPEPHGRMGDLDALEELILNDPSCITAFDAIKKLQGMPTIIPAEGGDVK